MIARILGCAEVGNMGGVGPNCVQCIAMSKG